MSEEDSEKDHSGREELEEMVRKMLSSGQIDPEALSKVAGLGANPAMMGQMFSQLRNLMSDSEASLERPSLIFMRDILASRGAVT